VQVELRTNTTEGGVNVANQWAGQHSVINVSENEEEGID
jgi:hypothetical protein